MRIFSGGSNLDISEFGCGSITVASGNAVFVKAVRKLISFGPKRFIEGSLVPSICFASFLIGNGGLLPGIVGRCRGSCGVALGCSRQGVDVHFITLDFTSPKTGHCTCHVDGMSGS